MTETKENHMDQNEPIPSMSDDDDDDDCCCCCCCDDETD
jgi:hypothetical protein